MKPALSLFLLFFTLGLCAQQSSPYVKFGKISAADLSRKTYPIDSGANAVVLSDIGEASIDGNSKGWFSIRFKRHRVVHILNKNGYKEADVEISLYTNGTDEEKLDKLKAVTYNLEGGKVVESDLEKSAIFKEKISKNRMVRKFTFPNVKEGCIIEYEYTMLSDYIWNLDPWYFQGSVPVLWSEYTLRVPQFFSYAFLSRGYHPLFINDKKDGASSFSVADTRTAGATERTNFNAGVTDYRWVMKDVPELKLEQYTSTLRNHITRIEFQLASQNYPLSPRDYRNTWPGLMNDLLNSENFAKQISTANHWLSDDLKPITASLRSNEEKARGIFEYVRDQFICTDHSALFHETNLKEVLRLKKGSVSEVNLLLTAMLRYSGIQAEPVIVSTTDHGYALEYYPMITAFNYVITRAIIDGKPVYLDASHPRLGFGRLLPNCYNGHARVVNEEATPVFLSADSVLEKKTTAMFLAVTPKGWSGSMSQSNGYYESYMIRERIREKGKEAFITQLEKDFGSDVKIEKFQADSLSRFDDPVKLVYEFNFDHGKEDIIYLNPMFGERFRKNPFASANRFYPVEMPYTMDETVIFSMEVPDGYVVDELPKQVVAKFDDQESAYFEYRITQSSSTISMRCRVKVNRTLFLPEEYETLREFYNLIVNKENEQIVLKKKK